MIRVVLFEWGTNKKIKTVLMDEHIPAVGEFFIDDNKVAGDDWEDKMYVVRAVTHFLGSLVALHIEKYDADSERRKWAEVADKLNKIQEDIKDGSKE